MKLTNTLAQQVAEADIGKLRDVWLALNKGKLARIAEEFEVTTGFVSDVFRLRRNTKDGAIESRLAELGAPGFAEE